MIADNPHSQTLQEGAGISACPAFLSDLSVIFLPLTQVI
jgi:hypothetical protein